MTGQTDPEWVAVDWGTSHLRAFAMRDGRVLDRASSEDGMGRLSTSEFEPALRRLMSGWTWTGTLTVVACGMVGSRQGWVEAPYRSVPCRPLQPGLTFAPTAQADLVVHVISGLSQAAPADVMRGEETQIAGFQALNPGWDGVICLPGTHTKWAEVSAGEVVSFQTFMTGELFALIGGQSVLRHSLDGTGWSDAAFEAAISEAMARPERLAARLFGLRAGDLLRGTAPADNRAALSGMLIGAELAAARPYWLGRDIAILGDNDQARAYARALDLQGVPTLMTDADRMTLAGLTAAYRLLKGTR